MITAERLEAMRAWNHLYFHAGSGTWQRVLLTTLAYSQRLPTMPFLLSLRTDEDFWAVVTALEATCSRLARDPSDVFVVDARERVRESDAGAGRYSSAVCTGIHKTPVTGCPQEEHVSTSYVERQNLTMRMAMRRFTRLTNAFSKKVENLEYAVSLHFMFYNFCRVHQTLRVTPAMQAGLSDHVWSVDELVALIPEAPRGSKKRNATS